MKKKIKNKHSFYVLCLDVGKLGGFDIKQVSLS